MADIDYEQRAVPLASWRSARCSVCTATSCQDRGDPTRRRGDGERITLLSMQKGIHKPRQLDAALAVTTSPPASSKDAPYDDRMGHDGPYVYHYRTAKSDSRQALSAAESDNEAVRRAKDHGLEIVYWHGVVPGQYLPFFPVRVAGHDPVSRTFALDLTGLTATALGDVAAEAPSRRYRSSIISVRMHQARFRARCCEPMPARARCVACGARSLSTRHTS